MTDTLATEVYQAIYLFNGDRVSRQMMVEEFEAVLDGFAPLVDFAGSQAQCAFAVLRVDLSIEALVCFKLGFDHSGRPDIHWNTPIKQLAQQAAIQDCFGQRLRLASYHSCNIAWHQQKLWQPNAAQFEALCQVIADNTLQLGKLAQRRAATTEIPTLNLSSSADLSALPHESYREQETRIEEIDNIKRTLAAQNKQLEGLQRERSSLLKQLGDEREAQQLQLRQQAELLKQKFAKLLHQNVATKMAQLKHTQHQLQQLELRFEILQRQNELLLADSQEQLMQQFAEAGIHLEVDHPGVGRLRIEADQVYEYMAAPMVYVAERAGVSPEHYGQWLALRKNPACRSFDEGGEPCRAELGGAGELADFVPGHSDCCDLHRRRAEAASESA